MNEELVKAMRFAAAGFAVIARRTDVPLEIRDFAEKNFREAIAAARKAVEKEESNGLVG